jgi:hypothetical protein
VSFSFSASYIALWVIVIFQGLLVLALLRQISELGKLVREGNSPGEEQLPAGSRTPQFSGLAEGTGQHVDNRIFDHRGGVILFLASDCSLCKGLANSLRSEVEGLPQLVAFCIGRERACARFIQRLAPEVPLLLRPAPDVALLYRVSRFPTAVVVDGEQKIRGYVHPKDAQDLKQLFARHLSRTGLEEELAAAPANMGERQ